MVQHREYLYLYLPLSQTLRKKDLGVAPALVKQFLSPLFTLSTIASSNTTSRTSMIHKLPCNFVWNSVTASYISSAIFSGFFLPTPKNDRTNIRQADGMLIRVVANFTFLKFATTLSQIRKISYKTRNKKRIKATLDTACLMGFSYFCHILNLGNQTEWNKFFID